MLMNTVKTECCPSIHHAIVKNHAKCASTHDWINDETVVEFVLQHCDIDMLQSFIENGIKFDVFYRNDCLGYCPLLLMS